MIPGTIIQGRYRIDGMHSDEGGMGSVLLVHDLVTNQGPFALKYCREDTEEHLSRFRREVRLMQSFAGNQRVVQLVNADLAHDPPFFVMPFYQEGDLRTLAPGIQSDPMLQEQVFLLMVDCVSELHRQDTFHRDIKPQNFLRNGSSVVVSDFGLSMELASRTLFTRSSQFWGTQGFIPPEFVEPGGFKNASAESDIFMLGKSFYVLATGRDPQFINEALLSRPLAFIVERCCKIDPTKRFHTLAQLRQAMVTAFNVILRRTDAQGEADFVLDEIIEKLKRENKYDQAKIGEFLDRFANLDVASRWVLVQRFVEPLFIVVAQPSFTDRLDGFLALYEEVVLSKPTSFAYAEVVSQHMAAVFKHSGNAGSRAKAFEITVKMAARMNRFAAMEKCLAMMSSVPAGDAVGPSMAAVIRDNPEEFLKGQEPVTFQNAEIRLAIQAIKAA
jgi:serine/threonine protein kinase